jgi:hypothetical protein
MGLGKYRPYKENFQDDGLEVRSNMTTGFTPDFYNRNTIQLWDVSAVPSSVVSKWKGITLEDRSLHEITIVNNNNAPKKITFSNSYIFPDSEEVNEQEVNIGPQGSAHFYCTAALKSGNLFFTLRKGSQDKRNI